MHIPIANNKLVLFAAWKGGLKLLESVISWFRFDSDARFQMPDARLYYHGLKAVVIQHTILLAAHHSQLMLRLAYPHPCATAQQPQLTPETCWLSLLFDDLN